VRFSGPPHFRRGFFRRGVSGVTLIEVLLFSTITAVVLLAFSYFLNKPSVLQHAVETSDEERDAMRALDRLVMDVKEADPSTLSWDVLAATAPLVFSRPKFDLATHQYETPVITAYYFNPVTDTEGSLMRVEDGTATLVLSHVETPTQDQPLFQINSELHILMVNLRFHPPGHSVLRVVRRIGLSG